MPTLPHLHHGCKTCRSSVNDEPQKEEICQFSLGRILIAVVEPNDHALALEQEGK